ncbi:MAG TPA: TPM domain-containing protein [Tepidisphaeraceae bacterium]|jgi:uncharacterized protein
MKRKLQNPIMLVAPLLLLMLGARAVAASNGVRDEAHFFSANAISQAEQRIQQIEQKHHKDLLVDTLPTIPPDLKAQYDPQNKEAFFEKMASSRAKAQGVDGVYVLITRDPPHLQVMPGNNTRQRLFPLADRDAVRDQLLTAFKQEKYDQGLLDMVGAIQQKMDANARTAGSSSSGSGTVFPGNNAPRSNGPVFPSQPRGWSFGSLACILIAVVLFVVFIRGIFGRSGGSGYQGGGYPQGGGYQQGGYPPGGYPQGGGYGGGGGGGFGRGFLGGLLGGALGGYAAEKWTEHGQQGGGSAPPASGGGGDSSAPADTSFDSSGGGGDFGGGGGGGGDSGGGGGGDFGGGGGGDSGGGDF